MDDPNNHPPPPDQSELDAEDARKRALTGRFIGEMVCILMGVCIGFFWCRYAEVTSNEANIIMMLLMVIIGLVRYIYLTRK